MYFDSILAQATCDLEKFVPANHFAGRPYSLEAYREISHSLLGHPHGLTPRELCAAKTIGSWVTSETATRKTYATLVTDIDAPQLTMTVHDETRLAALEHNARDAAHSYAIFVDNPALIKSYPKPIWMADTEPQAGQQVAAPVKEAPDPERRLAGLRALGGTARWKRDRSNVQTWQFTGIKKLVEKEKNEGRNRSDEKTIRADLRSAAEDENIAKRSGGCCRRRKIDHLRRVMPTQN